MNTTLSKVSKVLVFAAGAVIGSVVTYKLTEKKFKDEYERRLEEDTASIKEAFAEKNILTEEEEKEVIAAVFPEEKSPTYNSFVSRLGYVEDSEPEEKTEEKVIDMDDVEIPAVIDPQEYGEYAEYDEQTLYYYTDGVLADDMDNVVEDVEDIVGSYALTTFGMYEDDAVHVRNDRKHCYYEILRSECAYSEKYGQNLYGKEDE